MSKIPIQIDHGHIIDSIVELRIRPKKRETFFSVMIAEMMKLFPNDSFEYIANDLPRSLRNSDPLLMYQMEGTLKGQDFSIGIGPRSLVFNCINGYKKWGDFSQFIYSALEIAKSHVIDVERIGVRYTNFFEGLNGFDQFNISFAAGISTQFEQKQLVIRFSTKAKDVGYNVSIANNAKIPTRGDGFLVDVDAYLQPDKPLLVGDELVSSIEHVHMKEKEMFFSILKEEFIQKLNPKY